MRLNKFLLLAILILSLTACNFPGLAPASFPAVAGVNIPILMEAPAGATPTATPFQPLPPTPTYLPTSFPTATPLPPTPVPEEPEEIDKKPRYYKNFPGPSDYGYLPVPPPVGPLPQPNGQVNILLLGSDKRPGGGIFRTDTILLVTINPKKGTVHITHFPRDLYVYIPGWTMERINTAYYQGGFEALAMTFAYNFGVRPDHYVFVNFRLFKHIIDNLDGLDVKVKKGVADYRDGYGYYVIEPGKTHMDGDTVLWYVRSRKTTNDFDRGRRQQEVLDAIFDRFLRLDVLLRAPELYDLYDDYVITDLEFSDVAPFFTMLDDLQDDKNIKQFNIGPGQAYDWFTPAGAMVLLPNQEAVLEVMRRALNSD